MPALKKSTSEPRLSDRKKILEALRTRSIPEASECCIGRAAGEWQCSWPIEVNGFQDFWGCGPTPAAAHAAMCDKIEHALKESK